MTQPGSKRWAPSRWVVLFAVFGGALAWVWTASAWVAAATATAMWVAGLIADPPGSESRSFAAHHELVRLFDAHTKSLRALQATALPEAVRLQADEAVSATNRARGSVVQMAEAIGALDETIGKARTVTGRSDHAVDSIDKTVGRLQSRREALVERLTAAVDEVATVYAGLLELSVTARTIGVTPADGDVRAVNDAVTLLQMTFAELEADARRLVEERR
jgi:hypothetical protein